MANKRDVSLIYLHQGKRLSDYSSSLTTSVPQLSSSTIRNTAPHPVLPVSNWASRQGCHSNIACSATLAASLIDSRGEQCHACFIQVASGPEWPFAQPGNVTITSCLSVLEQRQCHCDIASPNTVSWRRRLFRPSMRTCCISVAECHS